MLFICEEKTQSEKYLTYEQMNILFSMQKMWFKIVHWIRTYTRAVIYNTPDKKFIANYLIELPNEIYEMLSIFYGTEVAQNLKNLFLEFVKAAIAMIEPIKYGDKVLEGKRITEWYKIADKISLYLAKINLYWDKDQWRFLLYRYIKLKIDEVHATVNGNYEEELKISNELDGINFLIANYLGRGIISSNK